MKKNKMKVITLLSMVTLFVFLTACGSSTGNGGSNTPAGEGATPPSDSKKVKIGVAEIDLTNSFFVRMKQAGDVAAKDYGVETVWQSSDSSLEKQISIVENFIQQKMDAILIDPIDAKGIIPAIKKAKEAGIPVITMGNKVEGDWNYNTLYPDYDNMGMVARALGKAMDGKGQVALLSGSAGNYVSDTREKGFTDVLKKEFPEIELVGVQPTNFDTSEAQRVTETWLNNYPDLKAIAFISDPLGLSAISAAEAKGKKLLYGGHDGDAEMSGFLEDGSLVIDVLTGAERVGYWNIAAAARIAKGTKFPTDLFMPTHFVSSDAVAQTLKDKGLDYEHLTPEAAAEIAKGYTAELGPDQPDERISGQK
ncbi:sugar ABC transporter substrate-binding protein [Paenibacillus sp. GCM10027626]|uniref:sugar ABC transporter substrate-binding protein n=1 Tax=Paenibacillus sp. GCM10027626 TaxID=3273411 RepID=UPI003637FF90